MLKDIRDGDQAYWCHTCERGWRAGHLPPEARVARKVLSDEQEARRAKAKALLEESLEVIPEVVIPQPEVIAPVKKPRASKAAPLVETEVIAPKPATSKPVLLEPEVSLKAKTSRVAKTKAVALVMPEPEVSVKTKTTRTARVKPTPKAVILETPAVIIAASRKPRTPKAAVPVILAQPAIPEVKKQKSRVSTQAVKHPSLLVQQDLFA
jgi:hypothetical protein